MKDNVLKKEFQEKDVNRIRNIVNKKYGDKTQLSVGYQTKKQDHKEGDVWEENDKQWTIKNGIKQTYTKLDSLKKELLYPLLCPKCNRPMKTRYDKEMFNSYRTCFTCVIELETKLRASGKYDEYIKALRIKNILSFADDYKAAMMEFIENDGMSFITEQGDIEKWDSKLNKEQAIKNIEDTIQALKDSVESI
jgi:hypothetical protein